MKVRLAAIWLGIGIMGSHPATEVTAAKAQSPPARTAASLVAGGRLRAFVASGFNRPANPCEADTRLALLKPPPVGAGTFPWLPDYLRVLERFPAFHARGWHELDAGGQTLGYYGAGDRPGAVTQARAMLAMAYLAAEPGYDPRPSGIAAEVLRAHALRSLRDLIHTHTTGDLDRVGGGRWGGDSAAALIVGPLLETARLAAAQISPTEDAGMKRVVESEADRLLAQAPAPSPPRDSRASDNAAAAECLAWAAAALPDRPNAPRWEQQARSFAMNALSAPQDRGSEAMVDARRVGEWVVTESLLPDYLLESGGAVNPESELRALASLSDGYYAYTSRGRPVPGALTHHYEDAWGAVRRLWLGGHRFAHPAGPASASGAGDDLAVFPVAALLEWVGSEPSVARLIERNDFQALEAEQMAHADGSFFGGRAGEAVEAEAAAALVMAALIHRRHGALITSAEPGRLREQLAGAWTSPAAALAAARSRDCFASWVWRGVGEPHAPAGMFVPLDTEALAAWGPDQLVGSFDLEGFAPARTLHHQERTIEGGFTATGEIEEGVKESRPGLRHFVAFAALPARRFAVVFDLAIAAQAVTVTRSEGLCLRVPIDGWNGRRTLRSEDGVLPPGGDAQAQAAADRTIASSWLNVDDRLGVAALYSQEPFTVREAAASPPPGGASAMLIDDPFNTRPVAYQAGQIVRDTVMLLIAGDAATTAHLARAGAVLPTGSELVRAAVVASADGARSLVAANFGLKETAVTLRPPHAAPLLDLRLAPLDTLVMELSR